MRFGAAGVLLLSITSLGYAQSVADAARQNQAHVQNSAAPAVITNEDLPTSGLADEDAKPATHSSAHQDQAKLRQASKDDAAARNWRTRILNQKSSIDSLRAHIDNLRASIRVPINSSGYYAAQANERTQARMQEIQDLQQKLQIENEKLQDLQESARKAGFGNAVYEP